MKAQDETARESPRGSARRHPTASIVARSLLASAAAIGFIAASLHFGSAGAWWPLHGSGDAVSESDTKLRAAQFATLSPLHLSLVPASESAAALDGMQLAPTAKAALAEALETSAPATAAAADPAPASSAAPAPSPQLEPLRLAWVTLWDTDAEDGDVVRLDSEGYSRTVTLAKKPVTFAVPVPRDGIIKVTGIRDGEGGGITVGLASGASQAVFPIMSEGQTLGLKVSFDR
jgi:hypothetical protein